MYRWGKSAALGALILCCFMISGCSHISAQSEEDGSALMLAKLDDIGTSVEGLKKSTYRSERNIERLEAKLSNPRRSSEAIHEHRMSLSDEDRILLRKAIDGLAMAGSPGVEPSASNSSGGNEVNEELSASLQRIERALENLKSARAAEANTEATERARKSGAQDQRQADVTSQLADLKRQLELLSQVEKARAVAVDQQLRLLVRKATDQEKKMALLTPRHKEQAPRASAIPRRSDCLNVCQQGGNSSDACNTFCGE